MKYNILLKALRGLVYLKRCLWWFGRKLYPFGNKLFGWIWKPPAFVNYKIKALFKKVGIKEKNWFLERSFFYLVLLLVILFVSWPQTKLQAKKDPSIAGTKTIIYAMLGPGEEVVLEEVTAQSEGFDSQLPIWKEGAIDNQPSGPPTPTGVETIIPVLDISGIMAGGTALSTPIILPGSALSGGRTDVIDYVVQAGDSLGGIAVKHGVSLLTVLWENDLSSRSLIRPGDVLRILPKSGLNHKIKRGDTLIKIAKEYDAKADDIVSFNGLKADGTDLVIGETIMIPGGTRPEVRTVVGQSTDSSRFRGPAPSFSTQAPSGSGFVWPSKVRMITQYFGWRHIGLDISGSNSWQSPIYAAKAGTVEFAQCGWNRGYGCYVQINHGGGIKTLYAHNSRVLVAAGQRVSTGQTIALMGNTGQVRGRTGIHLHFEVIVNGRRVNPLSYVR